MSTSDARPGVLKQRKPSQKALELLAALTERVDFLDSEARQLCDVDDSLEGLSDQADTVAREAKIVRELADQLANLLIDEAEEPEPCPRCGEDAEELYSCPECGDEVCAERCSGGVGCVCFKCENGEDDDEA